MVTILKKMSRGASDTMDGMEREDHPLAHLPQEPESNPASIGDDFNLVLMVQSLTERKLEVLNKERNKLQAALDKVSDELVQAHIIYTAVKNL